MIALVLSTALADCTAYVGGTVYLPQGPSEGATLVVDGATIGSSAEGCTEVDVTGKVITPGLVSVGSEIGLVEVGLESSTRDGDPGGSSVRASFQVVDGYNPRSTLGPVQRLEGVTSAVIKPSGGLVSGQGAWVDLAGTEVEHRSVAMFANVGGRAYALHQLGELLDDARAFGRGEAAFVRDQYDLLSEASRRDLEALQPVLAGDLPLVVSADRASDISAVVRFAEREAVQVVLFGAAEGWLVADELAAAEIPVFVNPLVYGPGGFDQVHGREDNAALLVEAGVTVGILANWTHNLRKARQLGGNAVRGGLDHLDAVRALTEVPAEVFGLPGHGELAVGATANVVIWSGDPLELSSRVETMLIHGEEVPLRSRQTALFERYRELPGSPVGALPLPE